VRAESGRNLSFTHLNSRPTAPEIYPRAWQYGKSCKFLARYLHEGEICQGTRL